MLDGVVRDYGNGVVVGPIDCEIRRGEFVSLLGPSGCGKTTLLRCVAGFETINAGRILVDGRDISAIPPHRRNLGLVFQSYALFPHLSVTDNVAFGLRLRRSLDAAAMKAKVEAVLAIVGLSQLGDRLPAQLSGGQQQRVAIARSLVLDPPLLLLDEPLSNLDFKLRIQMRQELRNLQRRLGMTFIYVTHDQTEALAMSDRVIVLSAGHVAQIGSPAEIYGRPRNRFVADFVGASNLLKVDRSVVRDGVAEVIVESALPLRCASGALNAENAHWVSIRPESIRPVAPGDADAANTFLARVLSTTFCGEKDEVSVQLLTVDGAAALSTPVTMHLAPGASSAGELRVRIDPEDAVLVAESAA